MSNFYTFIPAQTATPAGILVVIPGVNSGAYLFEKFAHHLSSHWHVLLINPPGVDGAPLNAAATPFSVAGYATYVATALKHAHTYHHLSGTLAILGHSLGSYAAQALARNLLKHPVANFELEKLVLVSSSPGQPYTAQDVTHLQLKIGQNFWQYSREIQNNPANGLKPLFGSWPQRHPKSYAAFVQQRAQHLPEANTSMAQLTAGGLFSSMAWARQLTVLTLCIHGTADLLVTATSGRALYALLPNATWLEYPDVGHFPMLERSHFAQAVIDFIGAVPQSGTFTAGPKPASKISLLQRVTRWFSSPNQTH